MVTLVVGYAILRGPGCPLFEAIGREKDGISQLLRLRPLLRPP